MQHWSVRVATVFAIGGPAHSFPPFFLFQRETFSFLDGLTISCITINWTDEQQTASVFSKQWKLTPPHDCKIAFSFQRRWLINSLIGNHQCMYISIVHALTISSFCFSCSCGRSYKKGVGYGMEMDSYKSQISDGVLVQKTTSYKLVSQIACVSVSFFWY